MVILQWEQEPVVILHPPPQVECLAAKKFGVRAYPIYAIMDPQDLIGICNELNACILKFYVLTCNFKGESIALKKIQIHQNFT